ncbi:MAG: methylmalonyl-CoA mutase family protein [Acidiferrobacterales bacterium]|nr:methylmalonyl-CoA mutase family protein [Acidiferrobacterales bacterium]
MVFVDLKAVNYSDVRTLRILDYRTDRMMAISAERIRLVHDTDETQIPLRFVTATSLFDGHDASINVIRRILQSSGVEVVHLGHNRSVREIVSTAIQEDADGIAVSSYQGGHIEFFKYIIDMLEECGRRDIKVFGGGGGVIVPDEIRELHDYGVARIYSPGDGQKSGLQGMVDDMIDRCRSDSTISHPLTADSLDCDDTRDLALLISAIERGDPQAIAYLDAHREQVSVPRVLGITGTGGSGKSSLTDELVQRFRLYCEPDTRIAILAVDPTRKKTGGALLGDRIRLNAIDSSQVFVRSLATRNAGGAIPSFLNDVIRACSIWGFNLVVVETPGIGQGDSSVVPYVDKTVYVMTPEFGSASQLEKIDMLDFADLVVINKFDAKGAQDAYRDVCKQVQRNQAAFDRPAQSMPVYGTISSRFSDDGVTALFQKIVKLLDVPRNSDTFPAELTSKVSSDRHSIIPPSRIGYLGEIVETVRDYHKKVESLSQLAREIQQLRACVQMLREADVGDPSALAGLADERELLLDTDAAELIKQWPQRVDAVRFEMSQSNVRDAPKMFYETISGTRIPKISVPHFHDHGDLLSWLMRENLPGSFPYTGGVFSFKRKDEDPTRMFAGEGGPHKTNRRFKLLSEHSAAKRLSTAFDSVSLYGFDPDERPDIYGKVGNSGVSVATLDDMKVLYSDFDLCSRQTSVSMTINGPAPTYLAMLLNTAIDQQVDAFEAKHDRKPDSDEYESLRANALRSVRGTVQADILKEDQGQNTCIFSTEFSLKVMGDIQEYFIANEVCNFYSVSISGYHIAEAGANPISQLAFTLANAFTYVEMYLARGMHIDDFASNLSFFFSNGMDAEYTVMGRVARRIWAVTMKEKYGANEKSRRLKYHIQTSGRSLHAQEINFNDIRTTLQALIAVYDNCNSLHTNAYDEAITTPTQESVRRAMAIQLIINKEWGLAQNDNSNQGSFIVEELTDLVEEAVLCEFESISQRGGVLGAMETGYQRGCIQDQSLHYERLKHDGTLPIVGVNMFQNPEVEQQQDTELARSTDQEKRSQLERLHDFHERHRGESAAAIASLQAAVVENRNVFAELMSAVRSCSVGQITSALFEVGGKFRRNM